MSVLCARPGDTVPSPFFAMNRTDRLYAITEELRRAGARGRTAAWLAERFEVTVRTIKRDVSALQQSGVPVWGAGGPSGGYVLDASMTLPPVTFTAGEATAVAAALAAQPDQPFAADGRSALGKVLGAMSPERRAATEELAGKVWLRTAATAGTARSPAVRVVEEGLRRSLVVVVDYVDAGGRMTQKRPVEPLAFAHDEGRWYLMAWCRRRRAGRWFRLDRIAGAWLTGERFAPRDVDEVFGTPPPDATPIAVS